MPHSRAPLVHHSMPVNVEVLCKQACLRSSFWNDTAAPYRCSLSEQVHANRAKHWYVAMHLARTQAESGTYPNGCVIEMAKPAMLARTYRPCRP